MNRDSIFTRSVKRLRPKKYGSTLLSVAIQDRSD